jgi:hypothetical protein
MRKAGLKNRQDGALLHKHFGVQAVMLPGLV